MSQKTVEKIIGKAVVDSQFREKLFDNPEEILSQYTDLTAEEKDALTKLNKGDVKSFAEKLDRRISKGHAGGLV